MQHYFFDIHWNGETVLDDEGTDHFDEGSALYYARTIANRLMRGGRGDLVQIHVREASGRLLGTIANQNDPRFQAIARRRAIVERDLARQQLMAAE